MALASGTRLGPHEIAAQIGEDGMGEVYRATDTKLKRDVAVKVLPSHVAADPERLARFQREVKTLAPLTHPNIAAIYGFEKSSGVHALVIVNVHDSDFSKQMLSELPAYLPNIESANSLGNGAPGRIRTFDPRLRRPVLYPTELRARER